VRFHGLSEEPAPEDVDGVLPPGRAHPLVADLRDQRRALRDRVQHRGNFRKLLHQRFLAVDVLVRAQRPEHDQRVVVVGRAHDHRVEAVAVPVERLAEVAARECVGMVLGDARQRVRVDIAEARERHVGVLLQFMPIGRRDAAADAHLQELQLAERARADAPAGGRCRIPCSRDRGNRGQRHRRPGREGGARE
jgi:hypothetical protein